MSAFRTTSTPGQTKSALTNLIVFCLSKMGLTVQAGLDVASQELGLQASATTPGLVFCTLNALYQTTF